MIDRTFEVEGPGSVEIRTVAGRIDVKEGRSDSIRVMADVPESKLTVEQRGPVVTVASEKRGFLSAGSVNVTVEVPPGCNVLANVVSADVFCQPPLGRLEVNSASGDIRFANAEELNAKTASGDVHGTDIGGRCTFVSASGDIHLGTIEGRSEISTASGDVHISDVSAQLTASTMSGDIYIRRFAGDDLKSKSLSGSVRLGIPAGTSVELDATTRSGDIRLPKPSKVKKEVTRHANIEIRLVSGDVTLNRV